MFELLDTGKKFKGHAVFDGVVDGVVCGQLRKMRADEKNADWHNWGWSPTNPEWVSFAFSTFAQAEASLNQYPPRP